MAHVCQHVNARVNNLILSNSNVSCIGTCESAYVYAWASPETQVGQLQGACIQMITTYAVSLYATVVRT